MQLFLSMSLLYCQRKQRKPAWCALRCFFGKCKNKKGICFSHREKGKKLENKKRSKERRKKERGREETFPFPSVAVASPPSTLSTHKNFPPSPLLHGASPVGEKVPNVPHKHLRPLQGGEVAPRRGAGEVLQVAARSHPSPRRPEELAGHVQHRGGDADVAMV